MSNSKLYQPPPAPPKPRGPSLDPLVALSKAPTMIAPAAEESLTDLTDDEALEEWAKSGTKLMPKPRTDSQPPPSHAQPQPIVPTMVSAPLPSFYPMAYSTPPRIQEKKTSAAIWVVPLALFILAGGVVAAAAGWYVYHTNDLAAAVATVDTSSNVIPPPPVVTLTTPTITATATASTTTVTVTSTSAVPATKRTATTTSTTTTSSSPTPTANGTIRTFAAGNGKPVYVDGKQVGVGGGKITTTCGHHNVSVGTGHAKSVDIPCNGSTLTVGTPDGT
jgi:hypothetical protein